MVLPGQAAVMKRYRYLNSTQIWKFIRVSLSIGK